MNDNDGFWNNLDDLTPNIEEATDNSGTDDECLKLSDGRPINVTLLKKLNEKIHAGGVTAAELLAFPEVFSCSAQEVRLALGQSEGKWKRLTKTDLENEVIDDPSLSLLVRVYLDDPESWPVKYTPPPQLDFIADTLQKIGGKRGRFAVLVGRNTHSMYRWDDPKSKPERHVEMLLSHVEKSIRQDAENDGSAALNHYMRMVEEEGQLRGVDIYTAHGWKPKKRK